MWKTRWFVAGAVVWSFLIAVPSPAHPQRGGRWDAEIQQVVQAELAKNDRLRDVRVAVDDGIVTLEGSVEVYRDKLNAEKKARHKEHVAGVLNRLEVRSMVEDATLRETLADKLRYDRIGYGIMFNNLTLEVKIGRAHV